MDQVESGNQVSLPEAGFKSFLLETLLRLRPDFLEDSFFDDDDDSFFDDDDVCVRVDDLFFDFLADLGSIL
jgi:hypothetical protein